MSLKSIFDSVSSLFTPLIGEQPSTELKEVAEAKAEYTVPGTNVRLLDTAVLLVPCGHQMPQESAKSQFGPMNGQYCTQQGLECPHCEQKVTGYLPDLKMRSLSQKVPQILGVEPKNQAQMDEAKESLRGELICPIELEPLTEGVALLPCAHRVNRAAAETMYGVMDGEFCKKQLQLCAECRSTVSGYIVDPSIRELSIALPQRLIEMEREFMPISERFKDSFQSFGLGLRTAAQTMRTSLADKFETIHQESAEGMSRFFRKLSRISLPSIRLENFIFLSESETSSMDLINKARFLVQQIAVLISNTNAEIEVFQDRAAVDAALDDFIFAFKNHCQRLGISATDLRFPIFVDAAAQLLHRSSREALTEYPLSYHQSVNKIIKRFKKKIFKYIVEKFASQRITAITNEKFKKTVQALKNVFGHKSIDAIAFELRRAIFNEHRRNLSDFSSSLLAAAADIHSDLFREVRRAHERTLKEMEIQLEAERLALGGRDWEYRHEGQLDPTYRAMERALAALAIAEREKNAARAELLIQVDALNAASSDEEIERFEGTPTLNVYVYRFKFSVFQDARNAFEAAKRAFDELKYRFEEIVSRLSHVRAQLAHLDDMVKTDMTRNAEFLSELAINPSTIFLDPIVREQALQSIVRY